MLVGDGLATNIAMFPKLGVDMMPNFDRTYFHHPKDPETRIYVTLDAIHMMKLLRNLLADVGYLRFIDEEGSQREVHWCHVVELYKLQSTENIRAANKLSKSHINFWVSSLQ